jgi:hypothetical protein
MMGIGAMEGSVGKAQVERTLDCDTAGRRQGFQRSLLVLLSTERLSERGELERSRIGRVSLLVGTLLLFSQILFQSYRSVYPSMMNWLRKLSHHNFEEASS